MGEHVQKDEFTLKSLIATVIALAVIGAWVFAIVTFGYPAIIVPAVTLAISSLIALVIVTAGG